MSIRSIPRRPPAARRPVVPSSCRSVLVSGLPSAGKGAPSRRLVLVSGGSAGIPPTPVAPTAFPCPECSCTPVECEAGACTHSCCCVFTVWPVAGGTAAA